MIFRKADASDAKTVLALYRAVIGTPFCVWDESYPGETEIQGDLAAGTLYVLARDSEVIGAISIVPENETDNLDCWKVRENAKGCGQTGLSAAGTLFLSGRWGHPGTEGATYRSDSYCRSKKQYPGAEALQKDGI